MGQLKHVRTVAIGDTVMPRADEPAASPTDALHCLAQALGQLMGRHLAVRQADGKTVATKESSEP